MFGLEARRWGATAWLVASARMGESRLFLVEYLIRALRVAVLASVWIMIVGEDPERAPIPLGALLAYTVIAEAFAHALTVESGLAEAFWQGDLVRYFLRPTGIVRQFSAVGAGRAGVDFVMFSLPLLGGAALLGVQVLPTSAVAGLLFLPSLALSIAAGLALEFIGGAIAMVTDQPIWLIENVRRGLTRLLSGAILPLAVLPFGLGEVLAWLPFSATAWAPLALYTGMEQAFHLLALQIFWVAVLWPIALGLWSRHRERVVAYGG